MKKYFLVFFISGSVIVSTFGIYKKLYGSSVSYVGHLMSRSKTISDTTAYEMFIDYHKSNIPERSEGVLLTNEQPIVYFYLDNESMILPLKNKAQSLGKEFVGIAAIPAFNKKENTHTIIWVGVVNVVKGGAVVQELMLPGVNEKWESFIYDQTMTCPEVCLENTEQLWNENWQLR